MGWRKPAALFIDEEVVVAKAHQAGTKLASAPRQIYSKLTCNGHQALFEGYRLSEGAPALWVQLFLTYSRKTASHSH